MSNDLDRLNVEQLTQDREELLTLVRDLDRINRYYLEEIAEIEKKREANALRHNKAVRDAEALRERINTLMSMQEANRRSKQEANDQVVMSAGYL